MTAIATAPVAPATIEPSLRSAFDQSLTGKLLNLDNITGANFLDCLRTASNGHEPEEARTALKTFQSDVTLSAKELVPGVTICIDLAERAVAAKLPSYHLLRLIDSMLTDYAPDGHDRCRIREISPSDREEIGGRLLALLKLHAPQAIQDGVGMSEARAWCQFGCEIRTLLGHLEGGSENSWHNSHDKSAAKFSDPMPTKSLSSMVHLELGDFSPALLPEILIGRLRTSPHSHLSGELKAARRLFNGKANTDLYLDLAPEDAAAVVQECIALARRGIEFNQPTRQAYRLAEAAMTRWKPDGDAIYRIDVVRGCLDAPSLVGKIQEQIDACAKALESPALSNGLARKWQNLALEAKKFISVLGSASVQRS